MLQVVAEGSCADLEHADQHRLPRQPLAIDVHLLHDAELQVPTDTSADLRNDTQSSRLSIVDTVLAERIYKRVHCAPPGTETGCLL
jgi:hypothetical protein